MSTFLIHFSSTLFTLYVHPIILKYLLKNKTKQLLTTSSPVNILQVPCSAVSLFEALQSLHNNKKVSRSQSQFIKKELVLVLVVVLVLVLVFVLVLVLVVVFVLVFVLVLVSSGLWTEWIQQAAGGKVT